MEKVCLIHFSELLKWLKYIVAWYSRIFHSSSESILSIQKSLL